MPLFMDVHTIEGGVAAGRRRRRARGRPGDPGRVRRELPAATGWTRTAGKIFCLVDAPDAEAANAVHREAHGLVADELYPVSEHA